MAYSATFWDVDVRLMQSWYTSWVEIYDDYQKLLKKHPHLTVAISEKP